MITPIEVRERRKALGWSVDELARRSRVGRRTIIRLEAAERKTTAANLAMVEMALDQGAAAK